MAGDAQDHAQVYANEEFILHDQDNHPRLLHSER
jgi:antirestriction protein